MDDTLNENFYGLRQLEQTEYLIKNGLRCVIPYHFTFETHSKGRWVGKSILEVFEKEFNTSIPQYKESIQLGKIKVNGTVVDIGYSIKNHDIISHTMHRHEPPVTNVPINILFENAELVVINKPSSIPVHPSGRYRFNTILFILAKEYGLNPLYCIHRLDRLTSGVLLLAKNQHVASKYGELIKECKVRKHYISKVTGSFPNEIIQCNNSIGLVIPQNRKFQRITEQGKAASTLFLKIKYIENENTSILYCIPISGRTHQIRIHLRDLNYPISNDPLYHERKEAQLSDTKAIVQSNNFDSNCRDCVQPYLDPKEEELQLYLHALRYQGPDFDFDASNTLPSWLHNTISKQEINDSYLQLLNYIKQNSVEFGK